MRADAYIEMVEYMCYVMNREQKCHSLNIFWF